MSLRSYFVALAVSCGLVLGPLPARAETPTMGGVAYGATFGSIMTPSLVSSMYGSAARTAGTASITNAAGGGVAFSRATPALVAGVAPVTVNAARVATSAALGRAFARALPLIGTVLALKDLADDLRCIGVGSTFDGALQCDPGNPPQNNTSTQYCIAGTHPSVNGQCGATAAGAADIHKAWFHAGKGVCGDGVRPATRVVMTGATSWTLETQDGVCSGGTQWYDAPDGVASPQSVTTFGCALIVVNGVTMTPVVNSDGKCLRNIYEPASEALVRDKAAVSPKLTTDPSDIAKKIIDLPGITPETAVIPDSDLGPVATSGPGTVTGTPTSTTTGDPPATTTSTPSWTITYEGPNFTWSPTTITTTGSGGTTTTTLPPEIKTCGLPGTPACKIDETGTPDASSIGTPPTAGNGPFSGAIADQGAKITEVAGSIVTPSFGFFGAPPVAECMPFDFPERPNGVGGVIQLPSINPCGVVDGVRGIMGWIWAIAGGWLVLGMIRRAVGAS